MFYLVIKQLKYCVFSTCLQTNSNSWKFEHNPDQQWAATLLHPHLFVQPQNLWPMLTFCPPRCFQLPALLSEEPAKREDLHPLRSHIDTLLIHKQPGALRTSTPSLRSVWHDWGCFLSVVVIQVVSWQGRDGGGEEHGRVLKTLLISAADVSWCGFSVCFSGKMLLHCDWLVYSVKVGDFGNWGRWTYANDSKFQILKQLQTTKILGLVYHHCISNSNRELLTDSSLYWSVKENWPVKSSLSHWVGPQQGTKIHIQTQALSTPRTTELFVHVVSVGGWATEWFVNSQLSLTASGQRWSWSEKRKSELLLTMTC